MGVHYLNNFIRNYAQNVLRYIHFKKEIEEWHRLHQREPIIVIDLLGLSNTLLIDYKDLLCGGRNNIYLDQIDNWFGELRECGATLVFFENGQLPDGYFKYWSNKKRERFLECKKIAYKILDKIPLNSILNDQQPIIYNQTLNWNILKDRSMGFDPKDDPNDVAVPDTITDADSDYEYENNTTTPTPPTTQTTTPTTTRTTSSYISSDSDNINEIITAGDSSTINTTDDTLNQNNNNNNNNHNNHQDNKNVPPVNGETFEPNINNEYSNADNVLFDGFKEILIPQIMSLMSGLQIMAKRHGVLIVALENDCHREMAEYATYYDAMAIVANNTDFLIYQGDWQFWSVADIQFDSFEGIRYDRNRFCQRLQLQQQQMPIFAVLCGMEMLNIKRLRQFHKRFTGYNGNPLTSVRLCVDGVAQYVNDIVGSDLPYHLSEKTLKNIAMDVFGGGGGGGSTSINWKRGRENNNNNISNNISLIRHAIEYYRLHLDGNLYNCDLLKCIDSTTYAWYTNGPSNLTFTPFSDTYTFMGHCSWSAIDQNRMRFGHFINLISYIIARQYGYLLRCKIIDQNTSVPFTYYQSVGINNADGYYWKTPLIPTHFPIPIPSLVEFLNEDNTELDLLRWQLLCWMISDKLSINMVKEIPPIWLVNCLVVFFLYQKKQITDLEADGFLITIDAHYRSVIPQNIKYPTIINDKLFRIAFLYGDVHTQILRCVQMLGLNKYVVPFQMDGLYFHRVVGELENSELLYNFIKDQIDYYRIFDILNYV